MCGYRVQRLRKGGETDDGRSAHTNLAFGERGFDQLLVREGPTESPQEFHLPCDRIIDHSIWPEIGCTAEWFGRVNAPHPEC